MSRKNKDLIETKCLLSIEEDKLLCQIAKDNRMSKTAMVSQIISKKIRKEKRLK